MPSYVHVYVADVDATHARAQQAGGTTWWIATRVGQ